MTAPITLPRAALQVADDGALAITIDSTPWPGDNRALTRADLPEVIAQIVREQGTPVRFDVADSGRTYTDILTPDQVAPAEPDPAPPAGGDIVGTGFAPGEQVQIAVVVAAATAGPDGVLTLRLPPTLRHAVAGRVVLVGDTGRAIQPIPGRGVTTGVTASLRSELSRPVSGSEFDPTAEVSLR